MLGWLRALLSGAITAVLTIVFIGQAVYLVASFSWILLAWDLSRNQLASLVPLASGPGASLFFLLTTTLFASSVARKAGYGFVSCGVVVGVTAAAVTQCIILLRFPPFNLREAALYLALGLLGGYLGGLRGRGAHARDVAFDRASRGITGAAGPQDVVEALGENLAPIGASGVTLWRTAEPDGGEQGASRGPVGAEPVAWWPAAGHWPPVARLDPSIAPVLAPLDAERAVVLRAVDVPDEGLRAGNDARAGGGPVVRAAFVAPLVTKAGERLGYLAVTSRERRPLGLPFPVAARRSYATVAAQVALALENMSLVQRAGEVGREMGVLNERRRLSRDMHDTLAQDFQGIVRTLEAALSLAHRETSFEPLGDADGQDRARYLVELAVRTARRGAEESRRMVWALRPESSGVGSLPDALSKLACRWSEETGLAAKVETSGTPKTFPPQARSALFRAAQEALNNVGKHARGATRAAINVTYDEGFVVLQVNDDGVGFDVAAESDIQRQPGPQDAGGFGILGVRERVEGIGGRLMLDSVEGKGTTMAVLLPTPPEPEPRENPDGEKPPELPEHELGPGERFTAGREGPR